MAMQSQNREGDRFIPHKKFKSISVVPNTLMRYTGLSHGAKLVWARLAQYSGVDGRTFPTVDTLACEVGLKRRQTQNLLAELKNKGFIETVAGAGPNHFYFLLHPVLREEGVQNHASRSAGSCVAAMQDHASKETKEKNQRKETTKKKAGRGLYFEDLSGKQQRYIELKTASEQARGNIRTSPQAFREGLVQKAIKGGLDLSGLDALEVWAKGGRTSQKALSGLDPSVIDRIRDYQRHDGRSPQEICSLLQVQESEGTKDKFWGLPLHEVSAGMRVLFPEHWKK